jgi:hypothetical protein
LNHSSIEIPAGQRPAAKSGPLLQALLAFFAVAGVWNAIAPLPLRHISQQALFGWQSLLFFTALVILGAGLGRLTGLEPGWTVPFRFGETLGVPLLVGVVLGVALALADRFSHYAALQAQALGVPTLAVPMPQALWLYALAAVCAAVLYQAFLLPFGVWLFSVLLLGRRWQQAAFWLVAVATALLEASAWVNRLSLRAQPALWGIAAAAFALNLIGAWWFRKSGLLAAIAVRLSARLVWHIIS